MGSDHAILVLLLFGGVHRGFTSPCAHPLWKLLCCSWTLVKNCSSLISVSADIAGTSLLGGRVALALHDEAELVVHEHEGILQLPSHF
jgi:hypothetical protein